MAYPHMEVSLERALEIAEGLKRPQSLVTSDFAVIALAKEVSRLSLQVEDYRKVLEGIASIAIEFEDPHEGCPAGGMQRDAARALFYKVKEPPKKIICDCGTPGCMKTFDHRKDGSGGWRS